MANTRQRKPKQGTADGRAGWTVRLLDDPALLAPDGRTHALEPRAAALFALAALERGVSRARAAALLWPDSTEARARHALRQQLLRLKKLAQRELLTGESTLELAPGVGADALCPGASGELLGGFDFGNNERLAEWVESRRAERRRGEAAELGQLLAEAEASGDLLAALRLAEQLVAADPASEAHRRTLMRLHYQRGDAARAQAVYDELRTLLAREFGAAPSAETEQLARAIREARQTVPAPPPWLAPAPSLLRPPRMIGRARALETVRVAVAAGRSVAVLGEAGLGKTRLLEEFAGRGMVTVSARARPGDARVPYALLARLLRQLLQRGVPPGSDAQARTLAGVVPEFGGPAPERIDPMQLEHAVEGILRTASRQSVAALVLDDMHFADEASVELLARMAGTPGLPPLLMGCRPLESEAALAPLRSALAESQALTELVLQPLTVDEVAELLASLQIDAVDAATLAEPLTRHTGGNPLYLLETLKLWLRQGNAHNAGDLPRPAGIGALIERRLKTLSAAALGLARVAAIAGADFSTELAEQVLGVRALALADAWSELEAAHVLRGAAFAHDLVQDAVARSVPAPIAAHTHRAVATYLEAHSGEPVRIAEHWLEGAEPARAAAPLCAAAERAEAAGRAREAAELQRRAAALYEGLGDVPAAFRCLDTAGALLSLGANADALAPIVSELRRLATSDAERARAEFVAARLLELRGEREAYARQVDATLTLAVAAGATDVEGRCRMSLAALAYFAGRYELAAQHMSSAVRVFQASGDREAEAAARSSLGAALGMLGRYSDSMRELEGAAPLLIETRNTAYLVANLSTRAVTLIETGDLRGALGVLGQARLAQRDADVEPGAQLLVARNQVTALRLSGEYRAALDIAAQAEDALHGDGNLLVGSLALAVAQVYTELGRADLAGAHIRAFETRPNVMDRDRVFLFVVRAGCDEILHGHPMREAPPIPAERIEELPLRCRVAYFQSGADAAGARQSALALATQAGLRGHVAALSARVAADALEAGEPDTARRRANEALRALDASDAAYYVPGIWLELHRVFVAFGDAAAADDALARAAAWVERVAGRLLPAMRDAFLNRNQVNRALLTAAPRASRISP